MIKLRNLTPDVYYNESRDFQFIGRLFDVVLNSVKTEADLLYNVPLNDDSNEKMFGKIICKRFLFSQTDSKNSIRLLQNCGFTLLKFAIWYWNTFLNKCGYVVRHHINVHVSLYVFLLMTYYLLFILYLF